MELGKALLAKSHQAIRHKNLANYCLIFRKSTNKVRIAKSNVMKKTPT